MADEMEVEVNGNDEEKQTHKNPAELAEAKKIEGNEYYKKQDYNEALKCYTQAIEYCPQCAAYYGNRSATYMMLNNYKKALEDARQAVRLDNTFVKGYLREGKCHLALGDAKAAYWSYRKVLEYEPDNKQASADINKANSIQSYETLAETNFSKGDYRTALFNIERCIDHSPACNRFRTIKGEALALLGRYQESQETVNDVLLRDGMNADALYVRGLCLYYQDNIDKAFQHFQQVLRLAPEHTKARTVFRKAKSLIAKKEDGNNAFRLGKYQDAYNLYTEALEIDPLNKFTNSKLYCNRATVDCKLNNIEQAVEDCTRAIELDESYIKAYLRRAKCYTDLEQYEEAVRDYEAVYKLDKSRENKRLLQEAKLELKKSKRKDYYKILGVAKTASDDELKKAYRKRALVHHPDRHSHDTPEVQKEEEVKFKEVGEAYSVLSDPKKRQRYDTGADLEEMDGGFDHFDPNMVFQTFFGGGGNNFSFGGPGGGSGGFPGFSFQFG